MSVERKFIEESMKKVRVNAYIRSQLRDVGLGDIEVKRTPLGTRVAISALKPGLVIGRKGQTIHKLTDDLKNIYKLDNPQLEVQEVPIPEHNAAIMASQLVSTLERGIHFRRASYSMVRQIMNSGALGVQIEISGKLSGARARNEKFNAGYIKHCGDTALQYVRHATAQARLKAGVVGVNVKVVPPEDRMFNELSVIPLKEEEPTKEESPVKEETVAKKGGSSKEKPAEVQAETLKDKGSEKKESKPAKDSKPKAAPKKGSKTKAAKSDSLKAKKAPAKKEESNKVKS